MIMELVVIATSLLRLFLVSAVYLLNIRGLLKLTWQPRFCVHALTTGAVLLAGILYLSSWAPYISYTLANGHWLLLGPRRHCLLQHFVSSEIGAVLLALLAVRLMYRCLVQVYNRPPPSAKVASLVICLAWLCPQLLYDAVAMTRDDSTRYPESYRFLDDLLVMPQGTNASHGYRVGFMICMQLLSGPVLSYYVWQFLVLIIPLSAVVIYCTARLLVSSRHRRRSGENVQGLGRFRSFFSWSRQAICQYGCKSNTFVDMALYYNFIWLVLLRPLAILHALYMQTGDFGNAFYMDFGSHLVLAFSAVFSPFSVPNPSSILAESQALTQTINAEFLKDPDQSLDVKVFAPETFAKPSVEAGIEACENQTSTKQKDTVSVGVSVSLKNEVKTGEESVC